MIVRSFVCSFVRSFVVWFVVGLIWFRLVGWLAVSLVVPSFVCSFVRLFVRSIVCLILFYCFDLGLLLRMSSISIFVISRVPQTRRPAVVRPSIRPSSVAKTVTLRIASKLFNQILSDMQCF